MRIPRRFFRLPLFVIPIALMLGSVAAHAADITVFAAASLSDALGKVASLYQAQTGHAVAVSFAASPVLAHQIEHAQGADVFMSAETEWMDYLDKLGLIARKTRRNLLGNHLVLIAPADSKVALQIRRGFELRGALHGGRLALADPDSVPAGRYAKASLEALGVWNSVSAQLAPAENVRAALAYVARGETPLGIVYSTDALAEPRVRVVDTFPDSTHPPIVYPAALTKEARPLARDFLRYLEGPASRSIFHKAGFVLLSGR